MSNFLDDIISEWLLDALTVLLVCLAVLVTITIKGEISYGAWNLHPLVPVIFKPYVAAGLVISVWVTSALVRAVSFSRRRWYY